MIPALSRPPRSPLRAVLGVTFGSYVDLQGIARKLNLAGKSRLGGLAALLLVGIGFVSLAAALGGLWDKLYQGLRDVGQPGLVVVTGFMGAQFGILLFGVAYLMSALFFSKDLPRLVALPIPGWQVLFSRFLAVAATELVTAGFLLLPPLVVYGLGEGVPWSYWPATAAVWLLSPMLPLSLAALGTLALARAGSFFRNRDAMYIVGSLLGLAFLIAFQVVNIRLNSDPAARAELARMLAERNGAIEAAARVYLPALWATRALVEVGSVTGLGQMALFALASLAGLGVVVAVGARGFLPAVLAGLEGSGTHARRPFARDARAARGTWSRSLAVTRSPVRALYAREVAVLLRTPAFLMTTTANLMVLPVLILIGMFASGDLGELVALLAQPVAQQWVTLGAAAMLLFLGATNQIASTAVSREGRLLDLSRALPVAAEAHMAAKLLPSLVFDGLSAALIVPLLVWMLEIPALLALAAAGLGLLGGWATSAAGLLIDLLRPYLGWVDPQQAMKGNLNGLFGMLAALPIGGLAAAAVWLAMRWAAPFWVLVAVAAAVLALEGAVLTAVLLRVAPERHRRLGEAAR